MTSSWNLFTIGELVVSERGLAMGPFGSNITTDNFVPIGVPVIRGKNLIDNQFRESGFVYLSPAKAEELKSARAIPGDLVFTHRGTLGQVALIPTNSKFPEYIISQSQIRARFDTSRVNARFIHYWFCSPVGQRALLQNVSQTGVPAIAQPTSSIRAINIALPSLPEQNRIANVVGSIDDLIDKNKQIISDITTLCAVIANQLNEGGELRTFGEVTDIFGGGTPSTKDPHFWKGQVPWATPTDLTALSTPYLFKTSRMITEKGLSACSSKLFPIGSILMTSRATIGVFAINQVPVAVNQGFIVVQARDKIDTWFLYHEMLRRVPEFIQRSNGSTFLELSRGVFKSLPIVWPSAENRKLMTERLSPLHDSIVSLQREIEQLSETRDELLPLLLSGAITVKEIAA